MSIKLSIIIPIYNTEKYLNQCIDSVITQIEKEDEVILVNDGSTDNCGKICEEYRTKYNNVIVIHEENLGQGKARNKGINQSNNNFVIFLDSDDYWNVGKVSEIKNTLQNNPVDILYFDSDIICDGIVNNQVNIYDRVGKINTNVKTGYELFNEVYPQYFIVSPCMAVFNKNFLIANNIYFPEDIFYEDNLYSLQAILKAESVKYMPIKLYVRRYRINSTITGKIDKKRINDYAEITLKIFNLVKEYTNEPDHKVVRKLIDFCHIFFQGFLLKCEKVEGKEDIVKELKNIIYIEYYFLLEQTKFNSNNLIYLEDLASLLSILKGIIKDTSLYQARNLIEKKILENEKSLNNVFDKVSDIYKKKIKKKMLILPLFQPELAVGIYGIGKQTNEFLRICHTYQNKLTDKIIFIDSNTHNISESYQGRPLCSIRDIGIKINAIIISSLQYENEMYEMAKLHLADDVKIFKLYENEIREYQWEYL